MCIVVAGFMPFPVPGGNPETIFVWLVPCAARPRYRSARGPTDPWPRRGMPASDSFLRWVRRGIVRASSPTVWRSADRQKFLCRAHRRSASAGRTGDENSDTD